MTNKLFMLGKELAENFPRPTGNMQRDFLAFQRTQNLILDLCKEKDIDQRNETDSVLVTLLEMQKKFLEQMLYDG